MELNDRKTKIWTLLKNVYVQWNSNVITTWKFDSAPPSPQKELAQEENEDGEQTTKSNNRNRQKNNRTKVATKSDKQEKESGEGAKEEEATEDWQNGVRQRKKGG